MSFFLKNPYHDSVSEGQCLLYMLLKNINGIIQFLLFFFCQMNFNDTFYPICSQLNRNGGKGIMNTILSVQPGRTRQNLVFFMVDSTDKEELTPNSVQPLFAFSK